MAAMPKVLQPVGDSDWARIAGGIRASGNTTTGNQSWQRNTFISWRRYLNNVGWMVKPSNNDLPLASILALTLDW